MAFDLGEALKDVSKLDTGREQIEYIRLDLIDEDPNNFYQLSGVEELAANIELCGLQQPIRVRPIPGQSERYMIVSGHRRRKALELLAKDNPDRWSEVPCIVEDDVVSPALQQLRLIYANSNTRTLTSAEISEQAVQVEKLLYQLKEEGYEFPGRMRDHVAQAVNTSKSKLARLKVIRDDLAKCWQKSYKKNLLKESPAYELARLSADDQQLFFDVKEKSGANVRWLSADQIKKTAERFSAIEKVRCQKRGRETQCQNVQRKKQKAALLESWNTCHCGKCCGTCPDLVSCKYACPCFADKIKKIRADNRDLNRQAKLAQEEKDRPTIELLQKLWFRFGYAREQAGKSVQEVCKAIERYYANGTDKLFKELEDLTGKFTTTTDLPYSYALRPIQQLMKTADLLGCSVDYLLCRTDVKEVATTEAVSELGAVWHSGTPEAYGTYVAYVRVSGSKKSSPRELLWDGEEWFLFGQKLNEDVTVQCWAERPEF